MYNKKRISLIVKEWFELKTAVKLSDDTLSKLVDEITETKQSNIAGISLWVACKEALPKEQKEYFVIDNAGYFGKEKWLGEKWFYDDKCEGTEIIYWSESPC